MPGPPLDDPKGVDGVFDDWITVGSADGEAISNLGGPAKCGVNKSYYGSWDVQRWAFLVLRISQSAKSWHGRTSGEKSRSRYLAHLAFARGTADPAWAAGLCTVAQMGDGWAVRSYIRALDERRAARVRRSA